MRTHLQRATAIMVASGGITLALAGCQATTQTTPTVQPVKGLATCSLVISDTEIDEEALLVRAALSSYTDQLVATQESTRATATTATHTLVDDGCQLIILSGSNIDQQAEALADEFDQTKFVLVDAQDYHNVSEAEPTQHALNLRTIVFNTLHPSYVAGYLAAGMTSTGTIGVYADEPTDASMLAMDGFASGVLAYNLAKGSNVALAGWDATTSTPALSPDSASSGELAGRQSRQSSANDASPSVDEAAHTTVTSLLEQGADIVLPIGAGAGSYEALTMLTKNESLHAIGFGADWASANAFAVDDAQGAMSATSGAEQAMSGDVEMPGDSTIDGVFVVSGAVRGIVITSVLKDVREAIAQIFKDAGNSSFTSGQIVFPLSTDQKQRADLGNFESFLAPGLLDEVTAIEDGLKAGKITIDSAYAPAID